MFVECFATKILKGQTRWARERFLTQHEAEEAVLDAFATDALYPKGYHK